jgi:hypothetical protein
MPIYMYLTVPTNLHLPRCSWHIENARPDPLSHSALPTGLHLPVTDGLDGPKNRRHPPRISPEESGERARLRYRPTGKCSSGITCCATSCTYRQGPTTDSTYSTYTVYNTRSLFCAGPRHSHPSSHISPSPSLLTSHFHTSPAPSPHRHRSTSRSPLHLANSPRTALLHSSPVEILSSSSSCSASSSSSYLIFHLSTYLAHPTQSGHRARCRCQEFRAANQGRISSQPNPKPNQQPRDPTLWSVRFLYDYSTTVTRTDDQTSRRISSAQLNSPPFSILPPSELPVAPSPSAQSPLLRLNLSCLTLSQVTPSSRRRPHCHYLSC